jgi:hypothetical protein
VTLPNASQAFTWCVVAIKAVCAGGESVCGGVSLFRYCEVVLITLLYPLAAASLDCRFPCSVYVMSTHVKSQHDVRLVLG